MWERVAIVLVKAWWPKKFVRWSQGEPVGWKRAFVVAGQHPAWGAKLVEQAGATPLTTSLILRHQEHRPANIAPADVEDKLLRLLQDLDNAL
jgi:hypothetical protein